MESALGAAAGLGRWFVGGAVLLNAGVFRMWMCRSTRVMQSKLFVRFNIFGAWTIKELSPANRIVPSKQKYRGNGFLYHELQDMQGTKVVLELFELINCSFKRHRGWSRN